MAEPGFADLGTAGMAELGAAGIGVLVVCLPADAVDNRALLGVAATAADPLLASVAGEPAPPDAAQRVALDVHPVSSSATTIHCPVYLLREPSLSKVVPTDSVDP